MLLAIIQPERERERERSSGSPWGQSYSEIAKETASVYTLADVIPNTEIAWCKADIIIK